VLTVLLNLWLEMVYIFHACAMYSPIGRSAQFCSVLFEVPLRDLGGVNRGLAWQL